MWVPVAFQVVESDVCPPQVSRHIPLKEIIPPIYTSPSRKAHILVYNTQVHAGTIIVSSLMPDILFLKSKRIP